MVSLTSQSLKQNPAFVAKTSMTAAEAGRLTGEAQGEVMVTGM